MNFYTENVSIPCGYIHFQQVNQLNQIESSQLAFSLKVTHPNGEKAKLTHESGTCQGTEF